MADSKSPKDEILECPEYFMNAVHEPLIVLDHDLRVISASRSFYEAFKVKPEDALGRLIYDLGNKQWDIPELRQLLETLLPQKTTLENYAVEHEFADIGRRTMLFNAREIQKKPGKKRLILLAIEDITERKRAEQQIQESEEKAGEKERHYRLLFEQSPLGVFHTDKNGIIVSCNDNFAKIIGSSPKALVGLDMNKLPDQNIVREWRKALAGSHLYCEDIYRSVTEKKSAPVKVYFSPLRTEDNTVVGCTGIVEDITEQKRSEEALRQSENYYRTIFETSGTAMFIIEADAIISHANSYFEKLSGYARQEVEGKKSWTEFIHPDDVVRMKENHYLRRWNPNAAPRQYEFRFITRRGETRNLLMAADMIPGTNRSVASCIDITQQKNSDEELRLSEQRFRSIFDEGPFAMGLVKPDATFIAVNKVLCNLLGYTEQELVGKRIDEITHEEDKEKSSKFSRQLFTGSTPVVRFKKRYVRKNGEILWVHITFSAIHDKAGNIPYGQIIIESLTESRKAAEKIRLMAYYDSLTGIANLTFHKKLIRKTIGHARRYKQIAAVIYIGLDRFKRINDTLGYSIGDLLLKAVADRLTSFLRKSAFAAGSVEGETENVISRPGGDEFIVLAHDLNHAQDAARLASRLLEEISAPYNLDGREVFITASMGIALYPDDATDVDELLLNAEKAMRHAKSKGINNYYFYSKSMHSAVLELLTLENDLHRALERKELVLYYQPKVDTTTRKITGMEALIRWNHPEKGLLPPMQFIPIAETSGLILPMGEFVIRTVCRQIKTWQEAGYKQNKVALNVSPHQFEKQDLVGIIKAALQDTQDTMISPKCLGLEITESAIMGDTERELQILTELNAMGIELAIDDFGTGYSSLSYLKQLPLDVLKIDKSFIDGVASDSRDQAIVRAAIVMAHGLNMKSIVEGVETEEQLSFLQAHGCDEIQGYFFTRPLPADGIQGIFAKDCL